MNPRKLWVSEIVQLEETNHTLNTSKTLNTCIDKMKNGHLPSSMGWIAYKFQLWPGVRYDIGTMTNDLEEAEEVLEKTDHRKMCKKV